MHLKMIHCLLPLLLQSEFTLTTEPMHTLVLGLVMSHLDFCNSVQFGLPQKSIKKLQSAKHSCQISS